MASTIRLQESQSTIEGTSIFTRFALAEANSRPVIVVLHGLAASSRLLVPGLLALAQRYTVCAPDLPGFGQSGRPAQTLSIAALADWLGEWLAVSGIERPILVGHSMGCQVVVEYGYRHPERVAGIVLIAPTGDPDGRSVLVMGKRMAVDLVREPPRLAMLAFRDYVRTGLRRAVRTFREMTAHPMKARLESLQAPALLVVGGHDPVAPLDWAHEAVTALPHGRIVVVPFASHGLPFTGPEALAQAIDEFAGQIST